MQMFKFSFGELNMKHKLVMPESNIKDFTEAY